MNERPLPSTKGITCGRMNCRRCTRWLPITEYRWRWRRVRSKGTGYKQRHEVPTIDSICVACRRSEEHERYHSKSLEERQAIGRRVNQKAFERKQREEAKLAKKIQQANLVVNGNKTKYGDETVLPLMPFRLWLLRTLRQYPTLKAFADEIRRDEATIRRWAEGIYWAAECDPRPISGIKLATVDDILTAAGAQDQLGVIYPYVEGD